VHKKTKRKQTKKNQTNKQKLKEFVCWTGFGRLIVLSSDDEGDIHCFALKRRIIK
jgi:hypothetical protein